MTRMLMEAPLHLAEAEAKAYAPVLKDFWSAIANGDALFDYPDLPDRLRQHFHRFSAVGPDGQPHLIDNTATLTLNTANPPASPTKTPAPASV